MIDTAIRAHEDEQRKRASRATPAGQRLSPATPLQAST